jgi:formylglycine-generating enzyme required for sulfatase activity
VIELRALEIMKEVRHPNVLGMFGAWQRDGLLILAMELADATLLDRLHQSLRDGERGIPSAELMEEMAEGAKGIDHLNGLGIQHRDIKPQNLLVAGGGVKVADFGLAKVLEQSVVSASGAMTPAYAAPEFFKGEATRSSDQYSLAISYCQLRANRLPFQGNTAQLLAGHLMHPPDLSMLPEAERPAVARALSKKPEDRWACCRDFVKALTEHTAAVGVMGPETPRLCANSALPRKDSPTPPGCVGSPSTVLPPGPEATPVAREPGHTPVGSRLRTRPALVLALLALSVPLGLVAARLTRSKPADSGTTLSTGRERSSSSTANHTSVQGTEDGDHVTVNTIGMKLVPIPAGSFQMGSRPKENGHSEDEALHDVDITKPFYLGTYPVTVGQFRRFVQDRDYHGGKTYRTQAERNNEKATWDNPGWRQLDDYPVVLVSWNDSVAFCQWLSKREDKKYRLPTEAEWEYACRATTTTRFSSGDDDDSLKRVAHFAGGALIDKYPFTAPVGSLKANTWGLHDVHGNVFQWCHDCYAKDYYDHSPSKDPQGPDPTPGASRVIRGGSWKINSARLCRSASRIDIVPAFRYDDLGFRVALSMD